MNGIITISDGMGTDISNGTIETLNLDLNNLICNNLQGQTPTDEIFLYTSTTLSLKLVISLPMIVRPETFNDDNNVAAIFNMIPSLFIINFSLVLI
jgi:hypothetical protein